MFWFGGFSSSVSQRPNIKSAAMDIDYGTMGRDEYRASRVSRRSRASVATHASEMLRRSVMSAIHTVSDTIERGTLTGTTLNTLCNVMGAGVLSLPLAMYNASVSVGLALCAVCCAASAFGVFALSSGCDETGKGTLNEVFAYSVLPTQFLFDPHAAVGGEEPATVRDVAAQPKRRETSRRARVRCLLNLFVEVIVFLNNYFSLVVYGRVIADSIPPVARDFLHASGFFAEGYGWLIIGGIVFFFLSCARKMEELKWTSLLGFITIFYVAVMVVVRYFTNKSTPIMPGDARTSDIDWFVLDPAVFKCASTLGMAFGYHYNVPLFYRELQGASPKKMMFTVTFAFPVIAATYVLVGICGYLTFGAVVAVAHYGGNIVNLYSGSDVWVNIGRLGLFFHFVCVYPILSINARQGFHRMLIMMHRLCYFNDTPTIPDEYLNSPVEKAPPPLDAPPPEEPSTDMLAGQTLLSITAEALLIVSTSVVVAYFVPGIGIVIEFVGAVFGMILMMILPGIIGMNCFSLSREHRPGSASSTSGAAYDFSYFRLQQYPTARRRVLWGCSLALATLGVISMVSGVVSLLIPDRK